MSDEQDKAAEEGDVTAGADVSDEEVEALLDNGESGEASGEDQLGNSHAVRSYQLVEPRYAARGRMPALDTVNQRWLSQFQKNLNTLMRQSFEVSLNDVVTSSYADWSASFPVPSSLNIYSLQPWHGNALIAIDAKLISFLVDLYYGGLGKVDMAPRSQLSRTESRMNRILLDAFIGCFKSAFDAIAPLQFEYVKTETDLNFVSLAVPSETVVVTTISLTLNDTGGALSFVIPLSQLDPVRDKLIEEIKTGSPESDQRWRDSLQGQLENTDLELISVFLETDLKLKDLIELEPGDILPIEMPKTATLYADGRALLYGKFGMSRGYNAVRITESVVGRNKGDLEAVPV